MTASTFTLNALPEEKKAVPPQTSKPDAKPHPWIINPIFDLLFVFGGMVWIVFVLQIAFFGWQIPQETNQHPEVLRTLLIVGLVGQYFFADAHTAATYMRVYETEESRKRFWFYGKVLPLAILALFTLAMINPWVAGLVVYVHLMWVYQHYTAQSFGIALVYCYKRGYIMNQLEKEVFRWLNFALAAFVISRILTIPTFSPSHYYGIALPFWGLPPIICHFCEASLVALTALFVILVVRKAYWERQFLPLPALALTLSVAGIGLSSGYANAVLWTYGPQFFHGSQYVAISLSYHLKEKYMPEGAAGADILRLVATPRAVKWLAITVLAGIFIYVGVPTAFEQIGFAFAAVATILQACLNFHHFLTDAAIWRLRDPNCRKILIA